MDPKDKRGTTMDNRRQALLQRIWTSQDRAYELMSEYDSLPHRYGAMVLYQAEAYVVNQIGRSPDITVTELAQQLYKTPSACSPIVRKLRSKGLVEQARNQENNRLVNLRLSPRGQQLYQDHMAFNAQCQQRTFARLEGCSVEELEAYVQIQEKINEAYADDVSRSKAYFGD